MKKSSRSPRVFVQPVRILIKRDIRQLIQNVELGKVLDVGGGGGRHKGLFVDAKQYINIDNDPKVEPDIVASADELPIADDSIDCILCSEVLEHVDNPLAVLREIGRVLRPGGSLILTVPFINEIHGEPFDFRRFTIFGLEDLVSKVKTLHIEELIVRGNWPITMWQLTTRYLIEIAAKKPILALPLSQVCRIGTIVILKFSSDRVQNRDQRFPLGYSMRIRKYTNILPDEVD